jgi:citrate lyase subunit beta/citryl-CoA lyase
VLIRINDDATPWYGADCGLLDHFGSVGVVLPKAERADQIAALPEHGSGRIVVPLIETARGLRAVDEIAAADGVQRLAFGSRWRRAGVALCGKGIADRGRHPGHR